MVSVSLTISKDKIKIVHLKGSYKKLELIQSQVLESTAPLPELVSAIKKFFKKNNIKTKQIGLNLSRRQVLVNIIELPPLKKDLIVNALKYEIEEHIPYPIEEVYYDYQILEQQEKKTNILLVAIRKEVVNHYLQLLSQVGMMPTFIDVDSFGVINLCLEVFSNEFKQKTVLLISSSIDCQEISLFRNEGLLFTKSLSGVLNDSILLEEIKKIIDYFQVASDGFKIDKIILTEGIDLRQGLKEELKIPVININPVAYLTGKGNIDELSSVSAGFREIKGGRIKIDLSPMKETYAREIRKKNYTKTGILLALIFILSNGIFYLNLKSKERDLQSLKTIIHKNQQVLNEIMSQEKQLLEFEEGLKIIQGSKEGKRMEFLDALLELSNILPSNVWIKNITLEGNQLKELRGATSGSASSLLPILEASPYFEQVEFSGSIVKHKMTNQEVEEFTLKAIILDR